MELDLETRYITFNTHGNTQLVDITQKVLSIL